MDEKFISYIWFNRLFNSTQQTLLGEKVEIVSVGTPNTDAGPDVFNAKVKIDNRLWAGCVEFHVKATDWHKHHHDGNPDYDHVILHVVLDADEQVMDSKDLPIPTIRIAFPHFMLDNYARLISAATQNNADAGSPKECLANIRQSDSLTLHSWFDRLIVERLEEKVTIIENILRSSNNNWEEAFYISICRAMGFGKNSDAMQAVAQSIPLNIIAHHRDNIEQIEALLLGQAGMLNGLVPSCSTEQIWIREYQFLKNKFSLKPIQGPSFKMLRMRPSGFPTIRMAQTAAILHHTDHLLRQIIESSDINAIRSLFSFSASDYWTTHYKIGTESARHSTSLSKSSIDILIINTVVPFLFIYGRSISNYAMQERAIDLLQILPPERNAIVEQFTLPDIKWKSAYDTQALLHLHRRYCLEHNCLRCHLGAITIKQKL